MGKVRYLGSKARLVQSITELMGSPKKDQRFVDLFCGTGIVSRGVGLQGWPILANDHLQAATILTTARLINQDQVLFKNLKGYSKAIQHLNQLPDIESFFYNQYSISKKNIGKISRPYFTEENARKIDAIRARISEWGAAGAINKYERKLLLADLIEAANQVANIAGTYGCFLKNFSEPSLKKLVLTPRSFPGTKIKSRVLNQDAFDVSIKKNDTVYIDPPYTKRQYAAYYHIPETIACEDNPEVEGITGLRPWKNKASVFCYKSKAASALNTLLEGFECKRILLSYSSDGHIPFHEVETIAKSFGKLTVNKFEQFTAYAPNQNSRLNAKNKNLTEFIFEIKR